MKKPIHPIDILVGQNMKQARLEKRVSQVELASALDITFQQIQKYEKGANRVSASKLYDMADFLEVDIAFFFGQTNSETNEKIKNDRQLQNLIKSWTLLSKEQRTAMNKIIRTLANSSDKD